MEQATNGRRTLAARAARAAKAMRVATTAAAAIALASTMTGCGGGEESGSKAQLESSSPRVEGPLLDDEGLAMPVAVKPTDAAAWTRNGRYASRAQADELDRALGDELVVVDVGCCGEDAVERALGMVWALQAAYDRPSARMRVVVRGENLRVAAATVNRLLDGGLREVWLVASSS